MAQGQMDHELGMPALASVWLLIGAQWMLMDTIIVTHRQMPFLHHALEYLWK